MNLCIRFNIKLFVFLIWHLRLKFDQIAKDQAKGEGQVLGLYNYNKGNTFEKMSPKPRKYNNR